MKQMSSSSTSVKIAWLTILICGITLLMAGILMLSIGKAYEAGAALGGLALIGLFLLITRRLAVSRQRVYFQAVVMLIVSQAILLGTVLDLYDRTSFYDKLNHGLAGMLLAAIGLVVFYGVNAPQRKGLTVRPGFVVFWCIAFAITGKVGWEFYEFAGDRILSANMQRWQFGAVFALTDTMLDLAFGLAGSLLFSLPVGRSLRKDAPKFYQTYMAGLFEHHHKG